ncbi:TPA: tryptophan synthase subunit beta [Klebsiella pneumoniae]
MLYVQRDDQGKLVRVEMVAFEGYTEQLASDDHEVLGWYSSVQQLRESDQEMIRVLEDLIGVLISKGVIRITDLPAPAQAKLMSRTQAREVMGGLSRLINDDETQLL